MRHALRAFLREEARQGGRARSSGRRPTCAVRGGARRQRRGDDRAQAVERARAFFLVLVRRGVDRGQLGERDPRTGRSGAGCRARRRRRVPPGRGAHQDRPHDGGVADEDARHARLRPCRTPRCSRCCTAPACAWAADETSLTPTSIARATPCRSCTCARGKGGSCALKCRSAAADRAPAAHLAARPASSALFVNASTRLTPRSVQPVKRWTIAAGVRGRDPARVAPLVRGRTCSTRASIRARSRSCSATPRVDADLHQGVVDHLMKVYDAAHPRGTK